MDPPGGGGGVQLVPIVAPVVEVPDEADDTRVVCRHYALTFKDTKQLKDAVMAYGTQAPFTISLLESFTARNLTPSDWQQLCRAALSGGDYLIWCGEYQERCTQTAQDNVRDGHGDYTVEMLTGQTKWKNPLSSVLCFLFQKNGDVTADENLKLLADYCWDV